MTESNRYSGAHLILAFLAGAVTGVCGALLSAPQPGRETRDSLRGWARDAQGQATRVPQALREAYHEAAGAAKKAFTEALKAEADEAEREDAKLTNV